MTDEALLYAHKPPTPKAAYEPTRAGNFWTIVVFLAAVANVATDTALTAGGSTHAGGWLGLLISLVVGVLLAWWFWSKARFDTLMFAMFAVIFALHVLGRWFP